MKKVKAPNRLLATILGLLITSSAAMAYDSVVVIPLSGIEGDATVSDVVKGKTFSSKAAGKGTIGILEPYAASTGDAQATDVLEGVTFSNQDSIGLSGAMPDNGAVTLTPSTTDQLVAEGYHNGSGIVTGDVDLIPTNIRSGSDIFGVAGTYTGATCVHKTGQTTSYVTGDDGDLEKGTAQPNPRFTDNGDGTVTDNMTALVWLKNANCFGKKTWPTAVNDSNGLGSGACGLTDGSSPGDWRLPNARELFSLIDFGYVSPSLSDTDGTGQWTEGDAFTAVQSDDYWSSSTVSSQSIYAWNVYLGAGGLYSCQKTVSNHVWPVRD